MTSKNRWSLNAAKKVSDLYLQHIAENQTCQTVQCFPTQTCFQEEFFVIVGKLLDFDL